jgi:Sulfotransferase domain
MPGPYPNLFVVGAPKAGTTSVCAQLNAHPRILFHPHKETHFFADDLKNSNQQEAWKQDPAACFAAFRGRTERYLGDGSTWHLFSRNAATNMSLVQPAARIVICLRNPVDLVQSLYHYRVANGIVPPERIETFIERERRLDPGGTTDATSIFIGAGRYFPQVLRYVAVFPPGQLHFVLYEDYLHSNQREIDRIFQYLELEPVTVPATRMNTTRPKRSLAFARLIAWRPPVVRKVGYALPKHVRSGLYRTLDRVNTTERPPEPFAPELRRQLADEFEADIRRLEALLGCDLAHWRAA